MVAQEVPQTSDRWNLGVKGFIESNRPRTPPPSDRKVALSEKLSPVCSVPLTRAQIDRTGVDYKIQTLPVPEGFTDGMPKVESTPACDAEAADLMNRGREKPREYRLKK